MNELQIEYLSLKPPIRHFDIEDATNYQIWFRKEELDIIQNSEYPEYILKLDVADREKNANRARHKILYKLLCQAEDNQDTELLTWVQNMIVNETAGFVKFFIKKMETDKNLYLETINQCFMVIIRDF